MTRNQTKTEPFPASATEAEAETPGHDHPGLTATDDRAFSTGQDAPGTSEQHPVVQGMHVPDVDESDTRS